MASSSNSITHQFRFALVGRTFMPTGRNRDELMHAIRNRWRYLGMVQIIPVSDEVFILNFPNREADLQQVLQNQPWSIYGQVLLLSRFLPGTAPQDNPLLTFDIWFSFVNLPYLYWSEEAIVELLQNVTPVNEVYPQYGFPTSSTGFRVRTTVLAANPLPTGVTVMDEYGGLRTVEICYEKLPSIFCSCCKRIGHRHATCPFHNRDLELHLSSSAGDTDLDLGGNHAVNQYLNLTAGAGPQSSSNRHAFSTHISLAQTTINIAASENVVQVADPVTEQGGTIVQVGVEPYIPMVAVTKQVNDFARQASWTRQRSRPPGVVFRKNDNRQQQTISPMVINDKGKRTLHTEHEKEARKKAKSLMDGPAFVLSNLTQAMQSIMASLPNLATGPSFLVPEIFEGLFENLPEISQLNMAAVGPYIQGFLNQTNTLVLPEEQAITIATERSRLPTMDEVHNNLGHSDIFSESIILSTVPILELNNLSMAPAGLSTFALPQIFQREPNGILRADNGHLQAEEANRYTLVSFKFQRFKLFFIIPLVAGLHIKGEKAAPSSPPITNENN